MRARRARVLVMTGGNAYLAGDEDIAPELEIQQTPDAVGGVFEAALVAGEQWFR